jgi:hypothetical protein
MHSRREFREKQASRMREAGFTDEEIVRWEKSSSHPSRTLLGASEDREGDVRSVKWKKRGEEREWDVGKVFNEDASSGDEDGGSANPATRKGGAAAMRKANIKSKEAQGESGSSAWSRPQNGFLKQFKSALG